ncbi:MULTISPECIES: GNAT family N-acetyltransferase [Chelativorans]|jgi:predicted N-acetyltransferase YhbS|uniref:GCN5-related N-acetyltransferase n=1 Tax=Chelativorans sp. (strain BNC1) TaxID=266779 RepID=Q11G99_CHESB|nr:MULTISPECIES: N-acetyltransferase [Chelativorans]
MASADVVFLPEAPAHYPEIEDINAEAFGPGRFAKAAYKIREGGPHERALSFVALHKGRVIASVRLSRIIAGEGSGLLLGPLAVRPAYKNQGIGRKLLRIALQAAREVGAGVVVLVGDEPYYGPFGFKPVPSGQLAMPRPVDPGRLLAAELKKGALAELQGMVMHEAMSRRGPAIPLASPPPMEKLLKQVG